MKRWLLISSVILAAAATALLLPVGEPDMHLAIVPGMKEQPEEAAHIVARHYAICYDAKDCPGMYSVRKHLIFRGTTRPADLLGLASTLEDARKMVPEGMTCLKRNLADDPVIVECWIP